MFEDSLVESSGKLKSKSSRYMGVTAAFNAALVVVMILIPLLYPEALPKTAMTAMLSAPPPPPPAPATPPAAVVKPVRATAPLNAYTAPTRVPKTIDITHEDPPPLTSTGVVGMTNAGTATLGPVGALGLDSPPPPVVKVVPLKPLGPTRVSSGVIAGNKLSGSTPVYPPIAKAAHISGAVVLYAIISKTGSIQSLSVVSGPEMLRANAVSAVQDWKYRPYLLNGESTEVETTITVNFSFSG